MNSIELADILMWLTDVVKVFVILFFIMVGSASLIEGCDSQKTRWMYLTLISWSLAIGIILNFNRLSIWWYYYL